PPRGTVLPRRRVPPGLRQEESDPIQLLSERVRARPSTARSLGHVARVVGLRANRHGSAAAAGGRSVAPRFQGLRRQPGSHSDRADVGPATTRRPETWVADFDRVAREKSLASGGTSNVALAWSRGAPPGATL